MPQAPAVVGLLCLQTAREGGASQLVSACNSEDISAGEVGEIIGVDPTLSVRLLQIANSPLYGYSGRINSISQAVVIVGLRALKNLAVSVAMAGMMCCCTIASMAPVMSFMPMAAVS